ncbi:MAG: ABC transporter substrate-binding protein [Anaerolineae bacterium]|nr:ABC transporter substrate-binding protein [Anaerolineae bacterium]
MRIQIVYRVLIVILIGLLLAACGGDDDDSKKSYSVGAIMQNPTGVETWDAFKAALADQGYTEGENITYYNEPSGALLAEAVNVAELDLIFVIGGVFGGSEINGLTQAKALAGGTIPIIVASASGDPVVSGDADSLAKPGGNITGLLLLNADDKRFQWFVEMLPDDATQVAVVYDPDHMSIATQLAQIEALADQAGVELVLLATPPDDLATTDQALADIPADVGGVFLLKVWGTSIQWLEWGFAHGVPTSQDSVVLKMSIPQPLMAYGPSLEKMGQDSARLAVQVFGGTKPGDLPFEYPDFYLTIDLGVSEAIGFEVPYAVLNLADTIRRSDVSIFASEPASASAEVAVVHPEGTGACAGTITTMGGAFTICVTVPCEQLVSTDAVKYTDTVDVGGCFDAGYVGVCAAADFDTYYYEGEAAWLEVGCGFMSGKWTAAE